MLKTITLAGAAMALALSTAPSFAKELKSIGVSDIWQYVIKGLVIIGAVALDRYRLQGSART